MVTTDQNQTHEASKNRAKPSVATLTKFQRRKLQDLSKGDEMNFTMGVTSMMMTTIVSICFPAYFWILHFMKTAFYLPVRYFRFRKKGQELYLLDWCYVVTYISTACIILAFLRITFGIQTALEEYNSVLLRAAFAMSCGPLIWSVYIFRNSIVFHDVDYMTSVFIHMSPFMLMWCLRWGAGIPSAFNSAFPEMIHVCDSEEEYAAADTCLRSFRGMVWCDACSAPPSDFVVPPVFLYVIVWSVPQFYFMFVKWRDWIKETKREILYSYFLETNPGLNAMFERNLTLGGVVGIQYAGPLGYMLLHLVVTVATSATSFFLWHSFLLHTAVFFFALVTAVHNGSQYMFRVFAYRYAEGQLQKHQSVLD